MSSLKYSIYTSPMLHVTGALLRGENRLVLGDFNAHLDPWHSCLSNDHNIIIASGGLINSIISFMLTLASDNLPIIISIEKPPDFAGSLHCTLRLTRPNGVLPAALNAKSLCAPFTNEEVRSVINKTKLSGINMLMLKHRGSTGVSFRIKVLNLSLTTL